MSSDFGSRLKAQLVKHKSKKQVGYLLSAGSPLGQEQQDKLKRELHSGAVRVKG